MVIKIILIAVVALLVGFFIGVYIIVKVFDETLRGFIPEWMTVKKSKNKKCKNFLKT